MSQLRNELMRVYKRKVVEQVERRVATIALDILGTIKVLTPVDTGRARSNWHLDVGTRNVVLVEPGGDLPPQTALYTIDKTIWISNNLPYIRRLNDGYSKQAPAGFVQDAVAIAKKRGERRKIKL
ncbi:HK97 gp10 family phage protein [Methylobacterium oryzae]|uniref:HK97 gp10 family phage protein n=1 Tax=Methylobacterium oryzae TaxID=334852 RepID=UPI002F2DDD07